jgi:hypothetical protein
VNHTLVNMRTLQEQLDDLIKRKGEKDPVVQMLRNQITAEKSDKSFYELYASRAEGAEPPKTSQPDISVLPFKGDWPGGVLFQGELLKSFERVLRGLKTRRKTNIFYGNVDELFNGIEEGYLNDVGDPIGNGMPIHYLQTHISEQGMADMLGLQEDELLTLTPSAKVKFARERIKSLESDYDADICPGYWLLPVTSNSEDRFFLGYSVTGYSFSGIEWRQEGAFLSEADFIKKVCCESKMFFENCLCVKGVPTRVEKIDDTTLLRLIWGF